MLFMMGSDGDVDGKEMMMTTLIMTVYVLLDMMLFVVLTINSTRCSCFISRLTLTYSEALPLL